MLSDALVPCVLKASDCSARCPILVFAAEVSFWIVPWLEMSLVASVVLSASLRTSSATTAKPRPASPARAASDGGIEGAKQVGLVGDFLDQVDDAADLLGGRLRSDYLVHRCTGVVCQAGQLAADALHGRVALGSKAARTHRFLFLVPQAVGEDGERLLRLAVSESR